MEPRRVRLGDVVDDYCPRERRVTGHAVVAMVGDEIRQTRCTACDAEHPYRGAQVPRRRRKDEPAALFASVAASRAGGGVTGGETGRLAGPPADSAPTRSGDRAPGAALLAVGEAEVSAGEAASASSAVTSELADRAEAGPRAGAAAAPEPSASPPRLAAAVDGEGPVRRSLIRATLPRPEGQAAARPIPEFTMRQPGVRPARAQGYGRQGLAGGHGHQRPHGSPHAGFRSDRAQGHARAQHRPGGAPRGKKRSR